MFNNLRGFLFLVYSFITITAITLIFTYFGEAFIIPGFAFGIYIVIQTKHLFKYKTLEEQFQEDSMKPKYMSRSNDTFYKNNNQPAEESVIEFTECSFGDEYSDPENFDAEYEDESMSRFSDSSDQYYQSIVNSNKDILEEE